MRRKTESESGEEGRRGVEKKWGIAA